MFSSSARWWTLKVTILFRKIQYAFDYKFNTFLFELHYQSANELQAFSLPGAQEAQKTQ